MATITSEGSKFAVPILLVFYCVSCSSDAVEGGLGDRPGGRWVAHDERSKAASRVETEAEIAILQAFKERVSGDPLGALRDWEVSASNGSGSDACGWTGVSCNPISRRVTALNLSGLRLEGSISPRLGGLRFLQRFDLSSNSFAGALPPEIGNCSSLKWLHLGGNRLDGALPTPLGLLRNLQFLAVQDNSFSSAIPPSLSNCSSLRHLLLGFNSFTGPIPTQFGCLRRLLSLSAPGNALSGPIPASLGDLSQLRMLDINGNEFRGAIPSALEKLRNLERLNLGRNKLSGTVPAFLKSATLPKLTTLALNANRFSGGIPCELGSFTHLRHLLLQQNLLTGPIPRDLGYLQNLQKLYLWGNNLTGPIPPELGQLKKLRKMRLRSNNLTGSIPDTLGACSSLLELGLSENRLTGAIPASLGDLLRLEVVGATQNRLTGKIPGALSKCHEMRSFLVAGNRMTGSVPAWIGEHWPRLQYLRISDNAFTGRIPGSIGQLESLAVLDVSGNSLTGSIPEAMIRGLHGLRVSLNLSRNQLSGRIPSELGRLKWVQNIDLSSNNLTIPGDPSDLGDSPALSNLNLSRNKLSGQIPVSLVELGSPSQTRSLSFSFNNLERAPPELGIGSPLNKVYKGGRFLGGMNVGSGFAVDGGRIRRLANSLSDAPKAPPEADQSSSSKRDHSSGVVIAVSAVGGTFVGVTILVFSLRHSKRSRVSESGPKPPDLIGLQMHTRMMFKSEDLRAWTEDFSELNILGSGSASTVYRGVDSNGKLVAVKKLSSKDQNEARKQLLHEVLTLEGLRHRNLVTVLGLCSEPNCDALVLDYIAHGSLHKVLHGDGISAPTLLSWPTRLEIAIGVAQGMAYLHHDCQELIIHRDLKPSNILLDVNYVAKVADFGISRFVHPGSGDDSTRTFCGTTGYIAPEYGFTTRVSTKGDVYSYGIVVLELVTGKRPTSDDLGQGLTLPEWVQAAAARQDLETVIDPAMASDFQNASFREEMYLAVQVGLLCTKTIPSERPPMLQAVHMLTKIKRERSYHTSWTELSNLFLPQMRLQEEEDEDGESPEIETPVPRIAAA